MIAPGDVARSSDGIPERYALAVTHCRDARRPKENPPRILLESAVISDEAPPQAQDGHDETATLGLVPRPDEVRPLEPGDRIGGRYEILRVLGTGGSSVVYAARDLEVGDELAVKVLRADHLAELQLKRSRREVAIARATASPRLVRVFDLEQHGDHVCLPMELVRGGSLREVIAAGPLTIARVLELATEIAEALAVLHGQGIVHRDVKPANLLLDTDGHVKLSDFGLARRWTRDESALTATGVPLGTIDYLSPEQATGDEIDPRSDLYSFGVVLYEMLTGAVPFRRDSVVSAIVARLRQPAGDVRRVRPQTPRWLARVVERLLEKDRDRRYATAEDVLRDLRARRASVERRKAIIAGAGVVATILTIGAAATIAMRENPPPRFIAPADFGLRALDPSGRELWSRSDIGPNRYAVVRRGSTRELAAMLGRNGATTADDYTSLAFLDLDTGRVLRRVPLPAGHHRFRDYSNRYGVAQMLAADVNHDGFDEIVISFTHDVYWPSYSVIHDTRLGSSRLCFFASGHHAIDETVDLDGDGLEELVFSGLNNRMGWHIGVAAVKVDSGDVEGRTNSASSPDATYSWTDRNGLLWYALNPQGSTTATRRITIDRERRRLRLNYITRPPLELTFDGFDAGIASDLPAGERNRTRNDAYVRLREAVRLIPGGFVAEALAEVRAAHALAVRAGDPLLADWIERQRGRALIAGGQIAEAESVFAALAQRTATPADLAFEAGRDFHLAGYLPQAIDWYRRGLGRGAMSNVGRIKWEFVEGMVLALGEMNRWRDAMTEINRVEASYGDIANPHWYRRYVEWRNGTLPVAEDLSAGSHDLYRYWALEIDLMRGGDPARLLAEVDRRMARISSARSLFLSLRAEVLARQGKVGEALQVARTAYLTASADRIRETEARSHFDLIAERYARLADRAGLPAEASSARREVARTRWRAR